jgi:hypothetical protein
MESEENLSELGFDKSCQTKVLLTNSVFLSAYPGFIVFGKTQRKSYETKNYFKFFPFELYKLYVAIIKILTFFTEEEPQLIQGLILQRSNNIVYFWTGITLVTNGKIEKLVSFCIETEENISKLQMTLSDLHNFISAMKSTIVICLCLNNNESEMMLAASDLSINLILKLKNYSDAKTFVQDFIQKNKIIDSNQTFQLIQLIHYYLEIIVIVHKFSSMSQFDKNNKIEEILKAI